MKGKLRGRAPRRKRRSTAAAACIVFRWDLDKTYLKSEFERVRDLVRIPFERGRDKVAAPGVAVLIRALRAIARSESREIRVYFLTASPPQIGRAIKEKLELDQIEYDGIAFKNQWQHLVRGKFRNLREQVGFKLSELLKGRRDVSRASREFLFGDDWESDPLVYSLYADILAGRVDRDEVGEVLEAIHVDPVAITEVQGLMAGLASQDVVARIYINLERRTPPANFRWFGARLIPTFNYFQTAVCLYGDGVLDAAGVVAVGRSLIEQSGYTSARLANSLADVVRRGHLSAAMADELSKDLRANGVLPERRERRLPPVPLWQRLMVWLRSARPRTPAPSTTAIDYRALVAEWHPTR